MDGNGDELYHIYVRGENKEIRDLTPEKGKRAIFYGWAHDGNSFFYGYNLRDSKLMDVYEMTIDNYESKMIYKNDEGLNFGGISNDKNYMALTKSITTSDNHMYLYELSSGTQKQIDEKMASYSPQDFDLNSTSLYYLTDQGTEFSRFDEI